MLNIPSNIRSESLSINSNIKEKFDLTFIIDFKKNTPKA